MKTKILSVVLALAALASVGIIHSASKRQEPKEQQSEKQGTYLQRLQRAKALGDKKLRSHSVIPLYAHVDLDTAQDIYDLVIGEFVSSKSFATDNDGNIVSWYKFKIYETVSKAKGQRVAKIDSPPAELLPVASDEILIWKTGGAVELDGMEIEMEEVGFPPFEKNKKYLLVLAVDPTQRTGTVEVGPSGVLVVKPDDTMEPINKKASYFKTQIENRYGASATVQK
ncbi:MAG TPA: hypothetical protein VN843_14660 [Anaerolineales bacterium]|nr:hypothetical protein [Anaerolineales bacterium]